MKIKQKITAVVCIIVILGSALFIANKVLGVTIGGSLNMGGNRIINMADPDDSENLHAVNVGWVNTQLAGLGAGLWTEDGAGWFISPDINPDFRIWNLGVGGYKVGIGSGIVGPPDDQLHIKSGLSNRIRTETTGAGYSGILSLNSNVNFFTGVTGDYWQVYENNPYRRRMVIMGGTGYTGIGLDPTEDPADPLPSAMLDVDGDVEINGTLDMTQNEVQGMVLQKIYNAVEETALGAVEGQMWFCADNDGTSGNCTVD